MVSKNALGIVLICCFMALGYNPITCLNLSEEEDSKLESQLKLLNKRSVISIQAKYGDWYDCVDFYEQPAFDHPLLKDHKYQYKMSTWNGGQLSENIAINPSDIWLNKKGCPANTVPIKRVTKEDLIGINKANELANDFDETPGVQDAVLRTTSNDKFYGGGMTAAIYHPAVQKDQYSSSHMKIVNGPDSISVGWTVNPSLYPDNETHLVIYTTTKDSYCYNTYCPGFVITSQFIHPDQLLKLYPEPGKSVWEIALLVYKDAKNGDWVFNVGSGNFTVGIWPQKIFTGLADSANYIEWGGEVYSPPGIAPPQMGGGPIRSLNVLDDCYASSIRIINENHETDLNPSGCETFSTSLSYRVTDVGNYGPHEMRTVFFGGTSN